MTSRVEVAMPKGPVLHVEGLRAGYGGSVDVLDGITLQAPAGSLVTVLGRNGAGKSTLLAAIAGDLRGAGGHVSGGSVTLDGDPLPTRADAVARRGVVLVPEGRRVFARLTVEENLRAGAFALSDRRQLADRREEVFTLFGVLADRRAQLAGLLSGGQQQMLAIARALMADPTVMLLDEPTLGLSPRYTARIAEVVCAIRQRGTAVLMVEQNAELALDIADHAYVLEAGRCTVQGPPATLRTDDRVKVAYLGRGRTSTVRRDRPRSDATVALDCRELSVRFGGVQALDGMSLRVRRGQVHALIGPNGAGKSTLLNVVSGLVRPDGGTATYGTVDLTTAAPHDIVAAGIGRTFQTLVSSPRLTVGQTLLLGTHPRSRAGVLDAGLRTRRLRREEQAAEGRIREVAAMFDLLDDLDAPVGSLPYGRRKAVDLARALVARPGLLLLDEPVAGMNAAERDEMARRLNDLTADGELTVLLVEHDMDFVADVAEEVTVMAGGTQLFTGTPDAARADETVIKAYLG